MRAASSSVEGAVDAPPLLAGVCGVAVDSDAPEPVLCVDEAGGVVLLDQARIGPHLKATGRA